MRFIARQKLYTPVSGVTCKKRTQEELLETLKITLLEILEYGTKEANRRTANEYEVS